MCVASSAISVAYFIFIGPLPGREAVKKLGGRASWRAIAPANPCPMRLGGSLALPISAGFEFFHSIRGGGVGCPQPERPTPEG
jgi:hypothetical protein